jgi:hypothetical protein
MRVWRFPMSTLAFYKILRDPLRWVVPQPDLYQPSRSMLSLGWFPLSVVRDRGCVLGSGVDLRDNDATLQVGPGAHNEQECGHASALVAPNCLAGYNQRSGGTSKPRSWARSARPRSTRCAGSVRSFLEKRMTHSFQTLRQPTIRLLSRRSSGGRGLGPLFFAMTPPVPALRCMLWATIAI